MKISATQNLASPQLGSGTPDADTTAFDFQAMLDTARQQRSAEVGSAAPLDATAAARKELEDYIQKGPIVYMRDEILKEMGLSEADLAKMKPEQRAAVEKEIAERIKERLLSSNGVPPQAHTQLLAAVQQASATGKRDRLPFDTSAN